MYLDLCLTHAEVQSHRSCSHVMMQLGQTPHAIFEIRVYPRFVRTLTIRGSSCRLSVPAWNVTICLVRAACQHVIEYLCFQFPAFHCLSHVRSKKSASYSFTAEELNRFIVIIFEKYARQRKMEEMPLSWCYINHEARLNLEKDVFGESTWAIGSPEQCTRGLSQLRRSFFD